MKLRAFVDSTPPLKGPTHSPYGYYDIAEASNPYLLPVARLELPPDCRTTRRAQTVHVATAQDSCRSPLNIIVAHQARAQSDALDTGCEHGPWRTWIVASRGSAKPSVSAHDISPVESHEKALELGQRVLLCATVYATCERSIGESNGCGIYG
jgi:hypothetical protein